LNTLLRRFFFCVFVLAAAVGLGACTFFRMISEGSVPSSDAPPVNGAFLHAAHVATEDLILSNLGAGGRAPDADPVYRCLARWENYDVSIQEGTDRYFVRVTPRLGDCVAGGERLIGGGGSYEIHKQDYQILSRGVHDSPSTTGSDAGVLDAPPDAGQRFGADGGG